MNRLRTLLLCIALLLLTLTLGQRVEAAGELPAECIEWGQAGPWQLTKCQDEDGLTCISSTSGMLNCNWDW